MPLKRRRSGSTAAPALAFSNGQPSFPPPAWKRVSRPSAAQDSLSGVKAASPPPYPLIGITNWSGICEYALKQTGLDVLGPCLVDIIMEYCRRTATQIVSARSELISSIRNEFGLKRLECSFQWNTSPKEDQIRQLELVQDMLRRYVTLERSNTQHLVNLLDQPLAIARRHSQAPAPNTTTTSADAKTIASASSASSISDGEKEKAAASAGVVAVDALPPALLTLARSSACLLIEEGPRKAFSYGYTMGGESYTAGFFVVLSPMEVGVFQRCVNDLRSNVKVHRSGAAQWMKDQTLTDALRGRVCSAFQILDIRDHQYPCHGASTVARHPWAHVLYDKWLSDASLVQLQKQNRQKWNNVQFDLRYDATERRRVEFDGVGYIRVWSHTSATELVQFLETNREFCDRQTTEIARIYNEIVRKINDMQLRMAPAQTHWYNYSHRAADILTAVERLHDHQECILAALTASGAHSLELYILPLDDDNIKPISTATAATTATAVANPTTSTELTTKLPTGLYPTRKSESPWRVIGDILYIPCDFTIDQLITRIQKM